MLFNSHIFLFGFLPTVLVGYALLGRYGSSRAAQLWLAIASFYFYAYWNRADLPILFGSICANYWLGRVLATEAHRPSARRAVLWCGIAGNLVLLGYFKYASFVLENVGALTGIDLTIRGIVLPLAISFFTFLQIAYLADAAAGDAGNYDFVDYCVFVTFFPHLIAGPIVHHRQMMSQFTRSVKERLNAQSFGIGITYFAFGLSKKVLIADRIARIADEAFAASAGGAALSAAAAWHGALAYTLQLYFDFSGYSDMAIGLGLMFGIRLPANFDSPYKATSIVDFWRRWHMTLSRFLRDYLYVPLGGNRSGRARRFINLMITMLLGGLWHGAGWNFLIWGALHGAYLMINHAWRALRSSLGLSDAMGIVGQWTSRLLTFLCVVIAWVFFRASDVDAALRMLTSMVGWNGWVAEGDALARISSLASFHPIDVARDLAGAIRPYLLVLVLIAFVWILPNTQQIIEGVGGLSGRRYSLHWQPSATWACAVATILMFTVSQMSHVSPFLYFQF